MSEPHAAILTNRGSPVPLVWYACYGSNLNTQRFACYVSGGTPIGGARKHVGCTDKTPPLASRAMELPQSLYFAEESQIWTGGIAFISHQRGSHTTKSRAYLITQRQFEEIAAEESFREEAASIDLTILKQKGHMTLGDGSGHYDELVYCGEHEGYPVVSFTSPKKSASYTKPVEAYVRMIGSGLMESHQMTAHEATTYLSTKPGIAEYYTFDMLLGIL
jgi:hypothetical protein